MTGDCARLENSQWRACSVTVSAQETPPGALWLQTMAHTFSSAETSAILGSGSGARFFISNRTSREEDRSHQLGVSQREWHKGQNSRGSPGSLLNPASPSSLSVHDVCATLADKQLLGLESSRLRAATGDRQGTTTQRTGGSISNALIPMDLVPKTL